MATQIISQAIIRNADDPSVQMSLVKAEIEKQTATIEEWQKASLQLIRNDIQANTDYIQQVRKSRNRLLADRKKTYAKRRKAARLTIGDIADAVGRPLILAWALFWVAGEKLGLWQLRRGATKRTAPIPTKLGERLYFAAGGLAAAYFCYTVATVFIAYLHYINR